MPILKPLTDYKTPTKKQQNIISELLSINEKLVPVVVPTQKLARPLIKLSLEIKKYKEIKKHVNNKGLDKNWLKLKLRNSIIEGKSRWNNLIIYLNDKI